MIEGFAVVYHDIWCRNSGTVPIRNKKKKTNMSITYAV